VIFSSGSTGEPKGVVLSHANVFSNVEGFYRLFDITGKDVLMGTLPFFHAFGFTATLCFPNCAGIPAAYHPNPTDAAGVGESVLRNRGTILIGTPTFLGSYLRRCTQEQFARVRIVVSGAEKLRTELSAAFRSKFGVTPFEGYGATELSPIVSVGCHDEHTEHADVLHIGYKPGTVGHPIPGVAAKVVDPDNGAMLPYGTPGLLLIKGPNVMRGYLNRSDLTAQVMREGWYVTGDIATIDHDGFITITDRLARFSKIGGEMVPHAKVEEAIMQVLGDEEPTVAVTAVPDEKKGERLAVLYVGDLDVSWVVTALAKNGLPNLWIPKKEMFFRVDALPILGSGKSDLKAVKSEALLRAHSV
jgi:acyl-[acyl-carrier-protein]-phospholipid O-acyltransferase/long-chain-fatty-acid--[acyl-carrier-protein] ligase